MKSPEKTPLARAFQTACGSITITLVVVLQASHWSEVITERAVLAALVADDDLSLQIQSDIALAVQHTRQADSHQALDQSGFSAQEVFDNIQALRSPISQKALCDALLGLASTDLALFDPVLSASPSPDDSKNLPPLPCTPLLRQRLATYWQENRARLAARFAQRTRQRTIASARTLEIPIALSQTPVITGQIGNGPLHERQIALSFEDGPNADRTKRLLAILKDAGVRATFFQTGSLIQQNSDLSRKASTEGHTIGVQSPTHALLAGMDLERAFTEIEATREKIATSTNKDASFIRLPCGDTSEDLSAFFREKKLISVRSNMDAHDWQITDASLLFDRILKELDREKGGILQMRETSEATAIALPYLLQELRARSFTTVVFVAR
jgi:peptidoglycan/xylan/chitin deacetylase (PgdA/CDA1 family)